MHSIECCRKQFLSVNAEWGGTKKGAARMGDPPTYLDLPR